MCVRRPTDLGRLDGSEGSGNLNENTAALNLELANLGRETEGNAGSKLRGG